MTAALQLSAVERFYEGSHQALAGVDLQVDPGEVVGLLGRNGAGKTTLLHLAIGMLEPHAGTVRTFGIDPRVDPIAARRRIGFVAEEQILPKAENARGLIRLMRRLYPTWDDSLADALLDRFEIPRGKRVIQLSKGLARQLALVCALAHRPELLLLDEPASGLDPAARREFLQVVVELFGETPTAIVFSSHHVQDVERIASRLCMIDRGRVLFDESIDVVQDEHTLVTTTDGIDRLPELPGFVRMRRFEHGGRAVVRGELEQVRDQLEGLRLRGTAHRLSSEDLFVELASADDDASRGRS